MSYLSSIYTIKVYLYRNKVSMKEAGFWPREKKHKEAGFLSV
jgi:hypothetical protein